MFQVHPFPDKCLGNTYIVEADGKAIIIDMGLPFSTVQRHCQRLGLTIDAVLLTHGHYDHIVGLSSFKDGTCPIYIGAGDEAYLTDPSLNLGEDFFGQPLVLDQIKAMTLVGEEELDLACLRILAIPTPFHTAGSYCFYLPEQGILFSGDTLFRLSIGRSDLPGSCPRYQEESLAKIFALPPVTRVYCGHGPKTDLAFEEAHNPYLH